MDDILHLVIASQHAGRIIISSIACHRCKSFTWQLVGSRIARVKDALPASERNLYRCTTCGEILQVEAGTCLVTDTTSPEAWYSRDFSAN